MLASDNKGTMKKHTTQLRHHNLERGQYAALR